MKIQILQTVRNASNPKLAFFKGKTYSATVATNIPRSFRIVNKGINVTKVFVERPDGQTMLLEKGDFVIKQFMPHERAELIQSYLNSKIKPPKIKLECPKGLKLREGFRVFNEKEYDKFPEIKVCQMGKGGERCGRNSIYIKEFKRPGKKTVRIGCCLRCGTVKENS